MKPTKRTKIAAAALTGLAALVMSGCSSSPFVKVAGERIERPRRYSAEERHHEKRYADPSYENERKKQSSPLVEFGYGIEF